MPGELDNIVKQQLGFTDQEVERINSSFCNYKSYFVLDLSYRKSPVKDVYGNKRIAVTNEILHSLYKNNQLARPFLIKCILDENIITEVIEEAFVSKVIKGVNQYINDVLKNKEQQLISQQNYLKMLKTRTRAEQQYVNYIQSEIDIFISTVETTKSHKTQLEEYLKSDLSDIYIRNRILNFVKEHYSNILEDKVYRIVQAKLIDLLSSQNVITKDSYLRIVDNTEKYNKKTSWIGGIALIGALAAITLMIPLSIIIDNAKGYAFPTEGFVVGFLVLSCLVVVIGVGLLTCILPSEPDNSFKREFSSAEWQPVPPSPALNLEAQVDLESQQDLQAAV